jgi:aldose 1-epimerase
MVLLSRILAITTLALLPSLAASKAMAANPAGSVTKSFYGTTSSNIPVYQYTLTNSQGLEVTIITYGGIIISVQNPSTRMPNIVLGFNNLHDYETLNSPGPHFGAIIGRYANRIANGVFTLDGTTYCLDANNGPNSLHGGFKGFDTKVWTVTKVINGPGGVGIELNYLSPAGDGWTNTAPNPNCPQDAVDGYPGDLDTYVTYTLTSQNNLMINYTAATDAATVVNLTNHTYWNLAGEGTGTIYSHYVTLNANVLTPVNSSQIPLGTIQSVAGTVFDFRRGKAVSADIRSNNLQLVYGSGFDLNWIVNSSSYGSPLSFAASVREPISNRILNVWTDQPGIQFYSGNSLDGTLYGTSNREYRQSDGLALETQHYPNSPNQPTFPSTVLLPGQIYDTTTVFQIPN